MVRPRIPGGVITLEQFLGAIFFSWGDLSATPIIQKIVLVNPHVYANEALRAILTPQIAHMPMIYSITGLIISILVMGYFGAKRFTKMATSVMARSYLNYHVSQL